MNLLSFFNKKKVDKKIDNLQNYVTINIPIGKYFKKQIRKEWLIMLDNNGIEISPMKQIGKETVFQGYGNSHFSYVQGQGFHATTQIPGMGQGMPISDHFQINNNLVKPLDPHRP